jgi:hypothetical protein
MERFNPKMIVASHRCSPFVATLLRDRCRPMQAHEWKESFLQRCSATLSLIAKGPPLGDPTATMQRYSPKRMGEMKGAYTMPFSPWNEHQDIQSGFCFDCGTPILSEALINKNGEACSYDSSKNDQKRVPL